MVDETPEELSKQVDEASNGDPTGDVGAADETADGPDEKGTRPEWVDDAEQALGRAQEALKAAWDATKDSREGALEAARSALGQISDAVDRGAEAAKSRWNQSSDASSSLEDDDAGDAGYHEEE